MNQVAQHNGKQRFNGDMNQPLINDCSAPFQTVPGYKTQVAAKDLSPMAAQTHQDFSNQLQGQKQAQGAMKQQIMNQHMHMAAQARVGTPPSN